MEAHFCSDVFQPAHLEAGAPHPILNRG
jgi:hypothetical protein